MKELVSFLRIQKEISEEEKQGRTSGSVEWRRARGELGESKQVSGGGTLIIVMMVTFDNDYNFTDDNWFCFQTK